MKLRRVYRRGSSQTRNRVIRGGACRFDEALQRTAARYPDSPSSQGGSVGARLYRAKGG